MTDGRGCPGVERARGAPELVEKQCQNCGGTVEFFTGEQERKCPDCGAAVRNDAAVRNVFENTP